MRALLVVGANSGLAVAPLGAAETASPVPAEVREEDQVDALPVPLEAIRPVYPPSLLREGLSGVVRLSYVVSAAGEADEFVVMSSEHAEFTRAAIRALQKVRFRPACRRTGEPVAYRVSQAFRFAVSGE